LLLVLIGMVGTFFLSLRLATVAWAGLVGVLLVVQGWEPLHRPAAKACWAAGVAVLVAGAWAAAYQPLAGAGAAILPVALFTAGALGCAGGLALASRPDARPATAERLIEVPGISLLIVGVYLLVVGLVARFVVDGVGGETALAVAPPVLALGVVLASSQAWRPSERVLWAGLTLAAVLGAEALFLDRYRVGGGVALLVVLTVWAALLGRGRPLHRRAGAVAAVLLPALSVAALAYRPAAAVGAVGLCLCLTLVVLAVLRRVYVHGRSGRSRRIAVALVLVAAVGIPAGGLAVLAAQIRGGPAYAKRYGTPVAVDVLGRCTLRNLRGGSSLNGVSCRSARWSAGGQPVFGSFHGTVDEFDPTEARPGAVDAFAIGDRAYTEGQVAFEQFTILGRAIPVWLLLGFPVALAAWLPLELTRPRRPAVPTRPAAAPAPGPTGWTWSHRSVRLSDVVSDALRLAGSERRDGEPVTTGLALAALMRMDVRADWQRIWLNTGDPAATGLAEAPDPPVGDPATASLEHWQGIPISGRLARALALLERLCAAYSLAPAGSGAAMLALVADRDNGATEALVGLGGVSHARLLRLVQRDILRLNLSGLSSVIPAATE
jgi:hypothetical protein